MAAVILLNAVTTNGPGTALDCTGVKEASFMITGDFEAAVNFEFTLDGTNWYPFIGNPASGNMPTGVAYSKGFYEFNVAGVTAIRPNVSQYKSGSITVTGYADPVHNNVTLSGSNIADADSIPVHATTNDPGEDDTRDVRYVLQAFDYVHISTAKTETLTPAEFLHSITVNKAGEANSTITVYDGAVGLGQIIAVIDGTVNGTKTFNVDLLETSLVIVTTGSTTPPDVTVSYR